MATFRYIDDDPDLLSICFAISSRNRRGRDGFIRHAVAAFGPYPGVQQTVCGRPIDPTVSAWEFELWSKRDEGWGVDDLGCKSCKKSIRKQLKEGTVPVDLAKVSWEPTTGGGPLHVISISEDAE